MTWYADSRGFARTRQTQLNDDEVIICDLIFQQPSPMSLLAAENGPEVYNLPYWLSTAPSGVAALVGAMRDRGIVQVSPGSETDSGTLVELTEHGGSLWEAERNPAWDAYVTLVPPAKHTIAVAATSEAIARRFLAARNEAGMLRLAAGDAEVSTVESAFIAGRWKRGRQVTVRMPLEGQRYEPVRLDWKAYESQRTWWTSVAELLASRRARTVPLPGRVVLPPELA